MGQLHVEAQGTADATPEAIWALISDADTYAKWGPWDAGGYEPGAVDGSREAKEVRWLRAGRTKTVEQVLEAEEPKRLVYTVIKGIPARNYRAEVTLTPAGSGTHVRWAAAWDKTLGGRLVHRALSKFYPDMVARLLSAAEQTRTLPNPDAS